jgi:uncharacterized membrane protein YedE/YeeE
VLPILLTAAISIALSVHLALADGRMAALFIVGLLLGITLYHCSFGFTSAYRRLLVNGELRAIRAQLLMLAVATLAFAPLLALGEAFGRPLSGAIAPVGVAMFCGAFLFGIGMQLGGGCGSGTLYAMGGGSPRMLVVLLAFCAGGFSGQPQSRCLAVTPRMATAGSRRPLRLGHGSGRASPPPDHRGMDSAVLRHGTSSKAELPFVARPLAPAGSRRVAAAVEPRDAAARRSPMDDHLGIYPVGSQSGAALMGWNLTDDPFWSAPFQYDALHRGILSDVTSVMDIGLVLGAASAALLARRFAPMWRIQPRSLAAAILGGLAMGYGARLAYGCNIGAFFSGVASTSLHGWLWIIAALIGSWIGVRLRPLFGLANDS